MYVCVYVCVLWALYLFMTRGLKIIINAWYELNWIERSLHLQFYCWSLLSLYNIYFISFWMIEVFSSACACASHVFVYLCVGHASTHYIFFYICFMSTMHKHTRHTCCYVNSIVCGLFTVDFYVTIPIFTAYTHVSPSSYVLSICQSLLALLFVQYVSICVCMYIVYACMLFLM